MKCPSCGSNRLYKDGLWKRASGDNVQRFLCRSCGYRFSQSAKQSDIVSQVGRFYARSQLAKTSVCDGDFSVKKSFDNPSFTFGEDVRSHNVTVAGKRLNALCSNSSKRRVCAQKDAKNLESTQKQKFCAGDRKKVNAETKGLLTQFYAYLEKEAYSVESDYVDKVKHLAVLGANLKNPEHVKTVIGQMKRRNGQKIKNGTKMLYCYAYDAFLKMLKIPWDMPTYKQEDYDPWVPDETEIDALINATRSRLLAAFLQCLKETFGDPSEVLRIKWIDVDFNNKTISIRYPVKNHLTGTYQVSNRLLALIDALPRKNESFPDTLCKHT